MPENEPLALKRKFNSLGSELEEEGVDRRIKLHVHIPTDNPPSEKRESFSSLSPDSLFDEALFPPSASQPALRTPPPIPGLFFDPSVRLSEKLADEVAKFCLERYFNRSGDINDDDETSLGVNQVMLFERAKNGNDSKGGEETLINTALISADPANSDSSASSSTSSPSSGLSPPLLALLNTLSHLLCPPVLPPEIHELLFPSSIFSSAPYHEHTLRPNSNTLDGKQTLRPTSSDVSTGLKLAQARQAILNLYTPGEGISSHVDLLRRFGDGIIGVSLCGSCVMRFERVGEGEEEEVKEDEKKVYDVYLPPNSIIVLSGDARYKWTHGIERRKGDWVLPCRGGSADDFTVRQNGDKEELAEWLPRSTRLSITFRWLLPGADVVGDD